MNAERFKLNERERDGRGRRGEWARKLRSEDVQEMAGAGRFLCFELVQLSSRLKACPTLEKSKCGLLQRVDGHGRDVKVTLCVKTVI